MNVQCPTGNFQQGSGASTVLQVVTRAPRDVLLALGFAWPSDKSASDDVGIYQTTTVARALKWLRDEKGVLHMIAPCGGCGWVAKFTLSLFRPKIITCGKHPTYEAAESALLDAVIKKLKTLPPSKLTKETSHGQ
jgi:hypothetical protein